MKTQVWWRVAMTPVAGLMVAFSLTLGSPLDAEAGQKFYLTKDSFQGGQALTACAKPFHMASLWEILDPSNLKYDTGRGYINDDSGSGAPANVIGWIRTGGPASGAGGVISQKLSPRGFSRLFHHP